jgi:hypothetical protein
MARITGKAAAVLVDEFDFSGVSNAVDINFQGDPGEVTAFADVDATFVEGKQGFTVNVQGMHSTASPNYDGEMFIDLTATQRRLGIYPGSDAVGVFGYEFRTNITEDTIPTDLGGAIALNVNWRGDEAPARGVVLLNASAISTTTTGTKFELPAVGSDETIVGVVRLRAAPLSSGSNNLVITIESDPNSGAGGETTRLTFTTINQASVALFEVKELAGSNTDTFWRAVATYSGAGSRTFDVLITFGIRKT